MQKCKKENTEMNKRENKEIRVQKCKNKKNENENDKCKKMQNRI